MVATLSNEKNMSSTTTDAPSVAAHYSKHVNTPNTRHFEILKNLKYVITPNTQNTGHFKILMTKLKYVNTANTVNTGHYENFRRQTSQIRNTMNTSNTFFSRFVI